MTNGAMEIDLSSLGSPMRRIKVVETPGRVQPYAVWRMNNDHWEILQFTRTEAEAVVWERENGQK